MESLIDIDLDTNSPRPDVALLFYGDLGVATVHRIGGAHSSLPRISSGRLVGQVDLDSLARILTGRGSSDTFILPDRALAIGSGWLTWYAPAAVRPMLFNVDGKGIHIEVMWPSLIFHAFDGALYAAAYEGVGRPGRDTPVYLPPLMNFFDSTAMCRGGASYPSSYAENSIPAWEAAVFDSYFSHSNESHKIVGCSSDEDELRFWRHPARRKHPMKAKHMLPINWAPTAAEWLSALHTQ